MKTIKFPRNSQSYEQLAEQAIDDNDFFTALSHYQNAKRLSKDKKLYYNSRIAEILYHMGQYELSSDVLFENINKKRSDKRSNFLLSQNMIALGRLENAIALLHRYDAFSEFDNDYLRELLQSDDMDDEDDYFANDIRITYSKSGYSVDEALKLCNDYIVNYEFKKAEQVLLSITQKDISQTEQLSVDEAMCICNLACGEYSKAEKVCERIIAVDENNITAVNVMIKLTDVLNQPDQKVKYLGILSRLDSDDIDDLHKIADTQCENKLHSAACKTIEKIVDMYPYDVEKLFKLAVGYFNCGDYLNSKRQLLKLDKLFSNNPIIKYFINMVTQVAESGEHKQVELSYAPSMPQDEVNRIKEYIALMCGYDDSELLNELVSGDASDRLAWLFMYSDDSELIDQIVCRIDSVQSPETNQILNKYLISSFALRSCKRSILYRYFLRQSTKTVNVVQANQTLVTLTTGLTKQVLGAQENIKRGYAYACSVAALEKISGINKLKSLFNELSGCSEEDAEIFTNYKGLAAAAAVHKRLCRSIEEAIKMFACETADEVYIELYLKKLDALLENKTKRR